MSYADDLRRQAQQLCVREPRRPRQASLRRAVSAAYYALFHHLIDESTRLALGSATATRRHRQTLGRAYSHASLAAACRAFAAALPPRQLAAALHRELVPEALQTVAATFLDLQEQRHRADYDLSAPFTRNEVRRLLAQLDAALTAWRTIRGTSVARLFLSLLPVWDKLRG